MQRIPVLMYHSISDNPGPGFRRFAISPSVFSEQLEYLCDGGYCPMTVSQLAAVIRTGAELPQKPVVLTFDDGFADFYTNALPALMRLQLTATLYLVTACIGQTSRWLEREGEADRAMLTWDQLRQIEQSGIECGSHAHTHPRLDDLPPRDAADEIAGSKGILDRHLRSPVTSFCYPYGYFSTAVRQAVQHAGYTSACAAGYELCSLESDPFALSRLIVTPDMTLDHFANMLSGRAAQTRERILAAAYKAFRRLLRLRLAYPGRESDGF